MENPVLGDIPKVKLPELHKPPDGLSIIKPLVTNKDKYSSYGGTADIYVGEFKGTEVVIKIARPGFGKYIRKEHAFLAGTYIPEGISWPFSIFEKAEPISGINYAENYTSIRAPIQPEQFNTEVRLVSIIPQAISKEMLAGGNSDTAQIVQAKAPGTSILDRNFHRNKDITNRILKKIYIDYIQFSEILLRKTGKILDSNSETDLLVDYNPFRPRIYLTRVDVTPKDLNRYDNPERIASLDIALSLRLICSQKVSGHESENPDISDLLLVEKMEEFIHQPQTEHTFINLVKTIQDAYI